MKAFEFDHRLIDSYARFSRSFSTIRSEDLKSEIDEEAWESLYSDTSHPLPKPASGRIAVR